MEVKHPLKRHRISSLFENMTPVDFRQFKENIEKHGFADPTILVHEGQVLEGWHRYKAAGQLGLLDRLRFFLFEEYTDQEPLVFAASKNLHRRHLSKDQKVQIAVKITEWRESGKRGSSKKKVSQNEKPFDKKKTIKQVAKEIGVSEIAIKRGKAVEKGGKAEQVMSGELTQAQALKEIATEKAVEREAQATQQALVMERETLPAATETKPTPKAEPQNEPRRNLQDKGAPKKAVEIPQAEPEPMTASAMTAAFRSSWIEALDAMPAQAIGTLSTQERKALLALQAHHAHPDKISTKVESDAVRKAAEAIFRFVRSGLEKFIDEVEAREQTKRSTTDVI